MDRPDTFSAAPLPPVNARRITPLVVLPRYGSNASAANCVRTPADVSPALANSPAGSGAIAVAEPLSDSGAADSAAVAELDTATRIWMADEETLTDAPGARPASCEPARLLTTVNTVPRFEVETLPALVAVTMEDSAPVTALLVSCEKFTPRVLVPALDTGCKMFSAAPAPAALICEAFATSADTVTAALCTLALVLALVADVVMAVSSDARTPAAALALEFSTLLALFSPPASCVATDSAAAAFSDAS